MHHPRLSGHHVFEGQIWKIRPDTHKNGLLAVETRSTSQKRVQMYLCNLSVRNALPISHPEPWWLGIAGLSEGVLLLHGYESPDLPIHKDLSAYDAGGEVIWAAPGLRFEGLLPGAVVVRAPYIEEPFLLDLHSGLHKGPAPQDYRLHSETFTRESNASLLFPERRNDNPDLRWADELDLSMVTLRAACIDGDAGTWISLSLLHAGYPAVPLLPPFALPDVPAETFFVWDRWLLMLGKAGELWVFEL
ncbi:MAG: DUF4905 domain-containing protein [Bacteroidetes bacterium]|nr:MAG: DUF4905 domain-containing protein [Bacteroidota bacterium]